MYRQQGLLELVLYFSSVSWQKVLKSGSFVLPSSIYETETNAFTTYSKSQNGGIPSSIDKKLQLLVC